MDEFFARAQLVKHRIDRVSARARTAAARRDVAVLEACEREMGVLCEAMESIREEQLVAQLEARRPKPRRRWWRRRSHG